MVLRAEARLPVARVTGVDACLPERVDVLARVRGESDMEMTRHGVLASAWAAMPNSSHSRYSLPSGSRPSSVR